ALLLRVLPWPGPHPPARPRFGPPGHPLGHRSRRGRAERARPPPRELIANAPRPGSSPARKEPGRERPAARSPELLRRQPRPFGHRLELRPGDAAVHARPAHEG